MAPGTRIQTLTTPDVVYAATTVVRKTDTCKKVTEKRALAETVGMMTCEYLRICVAAHILMFCRNVVLDVCEN